MGRRIDWVKIKREYVESNITLEELANKHKCSFSTLMKRSASERWSEEKKIFRRKLEERKQENKIDSLAS